MTSEAGQFGTSEVSRDELMHLINEVDRDEPRQFHIYNQLDFWRKRVLSEGIPQKVSWSAESKVLELKSFASLANVFNIV